MPDGGDSLVLPIASEDWTPPQHGAEIDGIAFTPKPELHITVIGNRLGRELREAFAAPWLRMMVSTAFAKHDWRFTRSRRHCLLRKPFVEHGHLRVAHSVIERVDLPAMAPFHRELGRLLGRQLPVPPPHVTLYVAGRAEGIGVGTRGKLRGYRVREIEATAINAPTQYPTHGLSP